MCRPPQTGEHIIGYLGGKLLPVAVPHQFIELLREVTQPMRFQDGPMSGVEP
jgi:hypothetical protein